MTYEVTSTIYSIYTFWINQKKNHLIKELSNKSQGRRKKCLAAINMAMRDKLMVTDTWQETYIQRIILFTQETYFLLTSLVSPVSLFSLCSPVCIFKGSVVASAAAIQSCKRSRKASLHVKRDKVDSRKLSDPIPSVSRTVHKQKHQAVGRAKGGH